MSRAARDGPVAALVWLGIAEAAPPAGTPVFIQVQGLAPTSAGLNGFIVAGDQEGTLLAAEGVKWVDGRKEAIRGPLGPVGFARAVNRDGTLIAGTPPRGWCLDLSGRPCPGELRR